MQHVVTSTARLAPVAWNESGTRNVLTTLRGDLVASRVPVKPQRILQQALRSVEQITERIKTTVG